MNVVVIAPHPDDETLGCGGTILRHTAAGDNVSLVIVTTMLEQQGYSPEKIERRLDEVDAVASRYGADRYMLGFPPIYLDTIAEVEMIQTISGLFADLHPEVVYLPGFSDVHSDHRIIFNAAWSCCKTFRCPTIKKVLMYETVSETNFSAPLPGATFVPNVFVDITSYLNEKIEIMGIYHGEMQPSPLPRSAEAIRALATVRGSAACVKYAEAFVLLKSIE